MNLINYIGLRIKIILKNDYYYIGEVLDADENSLDLLDIRGNRVSLSKDAISSIQEVSSNGY
ncbi:hypothetical protein KAI04_00085 [Candidatus Pacearchaeota archaeon]|nr:hypothetical protein [Candidatus Pacearchaeota archaeon]